MHIEKMKTKKLKMRVTDPKKDPRTLILVVVVAVVFVSESAADLEKPDVQNEKIQIETHSRDYKSGPIGGISAVTTHDQILLSVEDPADTELWQWMMVGPEGTVAKHCTISRVYKRGASSVAMKCDVDGVYTAYARKTPTASVDKELVPLLDVIKETLEIGLDSPAVCSEGHECLELFKFLPKSKLTDKALQQATQEPGSVIGFPLKIVSTEYCFLWAYKLKEIEKVGYVDTEAEPTDGDGSYISYRIMVWVAEANAMSEEELSHDTPQAEYSGVLTRRFQTKGLEPCFRFSHQAVELLKPEPKYTNDPLGEGVYWLLDFKVRTDMIVSTLSDISFTVGSRQHIALYGCFIAETRVLLDARQFSFLKTNKNEMQKINILHSELPVVMKKYVRRLQHIYGHFVRYLGRPWDYESTSHRRDMQVFANPCMTLEFGFAARSVSYMAQNWLSAGMDDVSQVTLPGLEDDDFEDEGEAADAANENKTKNVGSRGLLASHSGKGQPGAHSMLGTRSVIGPPTGEHSAPAPKSGKGQESALGPRSVRAAKPKQSPAAPKNPPPDPPIQTNQTKPGKPGPPPAPPKKPNQKQSPPSPKKPATGPNAKPNAAVAPKKPGGPPKGNNQTKGGKAPPGPPEPPEPPPAPPKPKIKERHRYFDAFDFAFTPTHLVILTADSHIILNPTSIMYKGFGYIRDVQSYRTGSLVQRRWCATTGTPKEHNLIVPAFSLQGNFIIVQILPVEKTTTMWLISPTHECLKQQQQHEASSSSNSTSSRKAKPKDKKSQEDQQYQKMRQQKHLEYCIHRKEMSRARSKLDEENVEEKESVKDDSDCKRILPAEDERDKAKNGSSGKSPADDLDSRLKFWMSGQSLLTERDPHFHHSENDDDPGKVHMETESADFNRHLLYEVDRKGQKVIETFEENGIELHSRSAHSGRRTFMWLHDVQFTAVERQFMQAIEFKSANIQMSEFSMVIINVVTLDEPVKLQERHGKQVLDVDHVFSGVLIVRPIKAPKAPPASGGAAAADETRLEGSVKTFTTNSALSSFVVHIDNIKEPTDQDVFIYATFDGTHARPLSYATYTKPAGLQSGAAAGGKPPALPRPHVRFTGKHPSPSLAGKKEGLLKPDFTMTEHGIVSILWRKANQSNVDPHDTKTEPRDEYPQAAIFGSIITPEPLRQMMPFKGSSYIFQRVSADGEVIFGDYTFRSWELAKKGTPPTFKPEDPNFIDYKETKFLSIPLESLMTGGVEMEGSATSTAEICPYADFVVHFIPFDFAEVEYRTRITAELVFLGSTLPLEADVLVEFDDNHGISVVIHSGIEETRDQTIIRKTVDIHTFLTAASLNRMYQYQQSHEDTDEMKEDIVIFSITMRPSIANLHCPRNLFFKTIQVNVGCNPFTTMRFISEAMGLKSVRFDRSTSSKDRENTWTVTRDSSSDDYTVTVPRSKINYSQRNFFECNKQERGKQQNRGYCIIPRKYSRLFKENIYSIHFTKSIVPKFEQFLTRHVRRVTGNVFLYKIFGGEIQDMSTNTSLLDSRCHNLAPSCAPDDASCGSLLNQSETHPDAPWTTSFFKKIPELDHHTDIYRHFRDCFSSHRITADKDRITINRDLPSRMHKERYWLFNSTNYNSFSFKKHRNMIFLIRAVVVNTPENGFTFCQKLETYFLLHITGVAPARRPLPWQFYLALIAFVLFIYVLIYFYFARSSRWKSEVCMRRIREEEEKEQREFDAKKFMEQQEETKPHSGNTPKIKMNKLGKWAGRLRDVSQDRDKGGDEAPGVGTGDGNITKK